MISENPYATLRSECVDGLEAALTKLFPAIQISRLALEKPPTLDFGQFASSLCFELAKQMGEKPLVLANRIVNSLDPTHFSLVERVVPAGRGYINFHADLAKFSALTIESVRHLDSQYGFVKTANPLTIIVEHTSVNPLHPIHIGQARNPMLGDAIARILKSRGHTVSRHYYVDDVGRQTSVVAYGYKKLGQPNPEGKKDHFIGRIYTITSCLIEINRLKRALVNTKTMEPSDDITKIRKELGAWLSVADELKGKFPTLFDTLQNRIREDEDPEVEVNKLNLSYEVKEKEVERLVRTVCEFCLQGFRETLDRVDVSYDSWDWESDFVWSKRTATILQKMSETPYVFSKDGVLEFEAAKAIQELNLRPSLRLKAGTVVPNLTLIRADGTSLYTTRDIAYTLWKFEHAEKVVNVIGMEQSLAQLQLKIALHVLGYGNVAENFFHFAYNLITLPGYKMSSRRGRYISFDHVIEEAINRAYKEVSKRSPQLSEVEKREIATFVGVGAVRYALVEVDPPKPVLFTWDRVLNFEKNSAPYLQYSHARACSIMRKAKSQAAQPAFDLLHAKIENEIVLTLASFPEVFIESAEMLKPNMIADFVSTLADKFNTFYNALPVLRATSQDLSAARLALVEAVKIVLRNALNLLGLVAPERM